MWATRLRSIPSIVAIVTAASASTSQQSTAAVAGKSVKGAGTPDTAEKRELVATAKPKAMPCDGKRKAVGGKGAALVADASYPVVNIIEAGHAVPADDEPANKALRKAAARSAARNAAEELPETDAAVHVDDVRLAPGSVNEEAIENRCAHDRLWAAIEEVKATRVFWLGRKQKAQIGDTDPVASTFEGSGTQRGGTHLRVANEVTALAAAGWSGVSMDNITDVCLPDESCPVVLLTKDERDDFAALFVAIRDGCHGPKSQGWIDLDALCHTHEGLSYILWNRKCFFARDWFHANKHRLFWPDGNFVSRDADDVEA